MIFNIIVYQKNSKTPTKIQNPNMGILHQKVQKYIIIKTEAIIALIPTIGNLNDPKYAHKHHSI